jgi:hypothetical protein
MKIIYGYLQIKYISLVELVTYGKKITNPLRMFAKKPRVKKGARTFDTGWPSNTTSSRPAIPLQVDQ